ncbi:LamG-like jellyroll fold domain-containing protein [Owenweeksia hongkongensis]|uniref:LamG-like jellyroll fold domain-containing protein n=1 Tax=Owenweeksia hongkongensis TaxID=253245 RepID=UPI003A8FF62D
MKRKLLTLLCLAGLHLSAQNALNFDGVDDYISSSFSGISGTSARTVEAWVRTTANTVPANGGKQKVILDWGAASPLGSRFTFNVLFNGAIRVEVGGNGLSGNIDVTDGQWHHVAAVYDPSSTNPLKLYVDGVLDVSGNFTGVTMNTLSGNFAIGRRVDGVNTFEGDIDEVKVWNVARSLSNIVADTAAEYCTLPNGLVAYYRLNEGTAGGANSGKTSAYEDVAMANGVLHNFSLSGSSSNWVSGANITAQGASFVSVTASACNQYISPTGMTYDSSGVYLDTLQNVYSCDSVIETTLTVNYVDVSVTATGTDLTANRTNATYRWMDCNDNYKLVPGGTRQTLTPPDPNGSYAVSVDYGGCKDTSACYSLDGVGLFENEVSTLKLFPNPTKGIVKVSHQSIGNGKLAVFSVTGQMILTFEDLGNGETEIDLSSQPKGIYFIKLEAEGETFVERLILD